MIHIFNDLQARKIVKDITNEEKFLTLKKDDGVYVGFDPTASSLHLGNYVQIITLKRFQKQGFKSIGLVGGATGMIGDPSGKNSERNLLSNDEIIFNKNKISRQLKSFGLEVIDNYDWWKNVSIIDFLRDIGKLLNINYMIQKDSVKSRLETGISFTEFSYQLIQGWDFNWLYDHNNVKMQIGGSDQWGNITSGLEIIRKEKGENNALGLTINLLTTSLGKKFGKSENNAVWLDSELTTPYEMYQYLLNTTDEDVEKMLMWLTFLEVDQILEIVRNHLEDPKKRYAQKKLATEVVNDIHGIDEMKNIEVINDVLFNGGDIKSLTSVQLENISGIVPCLETCETNIVEILVDTKVASSKRDARELIIGNAISINGQKIVNIDYEYKIEENNKKYSILKKGKKKFFVIKH